MVRLVLALDEAILLHMRRWRSAGVTLLMTLFTRLGDAVSWVFVALVLIACGGTAALTGLRLGVAAGAAALVSQVLKRLWRRARPTSGIVGFTALAAMLAAYEGIDLRLIAVVLCGMAVLAGSGLLDEKRSGKP